MFNSKSKYDTNLILASQAGDKKAYGRLVSTYQSSVRHFLRRLTCQNFQLADDIAQDAFIQGYRKISGFREDASFKSWITKIAYNLLLQHFRKEKRQDKLFQEQLYENPTFSEERAIADPDKKIDIEKALSKLSFDQRSAIVFCHKEGLSHQEVSEVMKIPLGTVKSHIQRGRERLKVILSVQER